MGSISMLSLIHICGESLLSGNFTQDILTDFAEKIRPQKLLLYSKRIQSALDAMAICGDRKIACELCLVELCEMCIRDSQ